MPSTGGKMDAVTIALDHENTNSIVVFGPYSKSDGQVMFGDFVVQDGEGSIFINHQRTLS